MALHSRGSTFLTICLVVPQEAGSAGLIRSKEAQADTTGGTPPLPNHFLTGRALVVFGSLYVSCSPLLSPFPLCRGLWS